MKIKLLIFLSIFFLFCTSDKNTIEIAANIKKGEEYSCTVKVSKESTSGLNKKIDTVKEERTETIKIEGVSADSLLIRFVLENVTFRNKPSNEKLEILCSTDLFGNTKNILNIDDIKKQVSAITSNWKEPASEVKEFVDIITMPKNIIDTYLDDLKLFFLLNNKKFSLVQADTLEDRLKLHCSIVEPKIDKTVHTAKGIDGGYRMNILGDVEVVNKQDIEKYHRKMSEIQGANEETIKDIKQIRDALEVALVNYKYRFSAIYQYPKTGDLPTDIVIKESKTLLGGILIENYIHDIQIKKKK